MLHGVAVHDRGDGDVAFMKLVSINNAAEVPHVVRCAVVRSLYLAGMVLFGIDMIIGHLVSFQRCEVADTAQKVSYFYRCVNTLVMVHYLGITLYNFKHGIQYKPKDG